MTGLCECGCKRPTGLAPQTNTKFGWVRGQPMRFVHGHNKGRLRHGGAGRGKRTPEYNSYRACKARCENPRNNRYAKYGARGIQFCFASFEEFLACLGPRPGPGYTVDRKDNDGHYGPGNVHWATKREQVLNRLSPSGGSRERDPATGRWVSD
jgi:hypothetical protein